ncbi:MAG: hypothetical protein IKA87_03560 [Lentisphaeria bacterium]|nr:hypothetical protein [Lentisphaeria bacterium]
MKNPDLEKYLQEFDSFFNTACKRVPQNNSFDITGTENSCWKLLVNEKGVVTIETQYVPEHLPQDCYKQVRRTMLTLFDPEREGLGHFISAVSHTCLDNWLPVSVVKFRTDRFDMVEEIILTDHEGNLQLSVNADEKRRVYKVEVPATQDLDVIWQMKDPLPQFMPDGAYFDRELAEIKTYWNSKLAPVLNWDFPHAYLKNGILSALVKTLITQYNGAIRYGATRYYCDAERTAESFPPTIITAAESFLFYGLTDEALRIFGSFADDFIYDGEIHHRGNGSSISEHGMILECFTNCCKATKNEDFFNRYAPVMDSVAERLLNLIREAGTSLIKGCPEDDLREIPHMQWFSSNLWAAGGLLSYSAISNIPLPVEEIKSFAARTVKCCIASTLQTPDGEFIPPCPEFKEVFADMNDFVELIPEDDIHSMASYANYRFYPEMLSSSLLPEETARKIIAYRKNHGGDFYGATTFRIFRDYQPYSKERCLDDWPLFNLLRGTAFYGDFTEHARLLAGHLALHQARGTYFAPEMSFRDHLDSTHCVPSQLTLPLAIRYLFPDKTKITSAN